MGTTAEKLAYLKESKEQIKNALETPSNVMRDYANWIKKYVDNQPTSKVSNGVCTNALDVPLVSLGVDGQSYQGENPSPDNPQDVEVIEGFEEGNQYGLPHGCIGVEQSGKNKFDNFKEYSYSNSNINTTSLNNGIKIEKKGGFALWVFDNLENLDGKIVRAKSKFNDGGNITIGLASLDGTLRTVMKENNKSDTVSSFLIPKITDNKKYLAVWLYGSVNSEISYEDLIVTIDNEDMTYEPYHEPKVISINLNGNILAKVGGIKDILRVNRNGEVEIEKNTWKDTINTSSLITLNNGNKGLVFTTSKKKPASTSSNDYLVTNAQKNYTQNDGTVYQNQANFVFVGNSSDTLESIQAKFNGGEILYRLETPQTIKLPSIEPIELWEGTNIFKLITNLETNFEVEYVVDKDYLETQNLLNIVEGENI